METLNEKYWQSKLQRKKADEDAKLLQNWINLLLNEENKARKKIDETRKKAKDILSTRQWNKDHQEWKW